MGFVKKQTFCVVISIHGERELIEGLPGDGERMERPLKQQLACGLQGSIRHAAGP